MAGLNYSRWNNLEVSSDESDSETGLALATSDVAPSRSTARNAAQASVPTAVSSLMHSRAPVSKSKPVFVKLHPSDDGTGLVDAFYEHPDDYKKQVSPSGDIESWGLFPYIPPGQEGEGYQDFAAIDKMNRKMRTQMLYFRGRPERPEDQFLDRVIENKETVLKQTDLGDLLKRDFVLAYTCRDEIPNENGGDRIWRTFRVSGGLKLSVFADKVLRPLMGWTRNFHAHVFTDFRDGSMFGPSSCGSVDMVHLDLVGYGYVPEEDWCIAHIFSKVGDRVGWLYDFGDRWYHVITLQEICSLGASTGAVTVLQGSGACPRENGNGNHAWRPELETIKNGTRKEREELINEMLTSVNYKERGWTSRKAFNIDKFDVADAQAAIRQAIDSKSSVAHGAKSFVTPLAPGGGSFSHPLERKEKLQQTYDPDSPHAYLQEVLSDRRDKVRKTACANCGSPHDLRLCTGCKQRYYCSVQCQRTHWKAKHKVECKRAK